MKNQSKNRFLIGGGFCATVCMMGLAAHANHHSAPERVEKQVLTLSLAQDDALRQKQFELLSQFDVLGMDRNKNRFQVFGDANDRAQLETLGFAIENDFTNENLAWSIAKYMDPSRIESALKEMGAQYPKLSRVEEIGKTTAGRGIFAIKL